MKNNAESDNGSVQEQDGDDSSLMESTKQEDKKVAPKDAPEAPVEVALSLSTPEEENSTEKDVKVNEEESGVNNKVVSQSSGTAQPSFTGDASDASDDPPAPERSTEKKDEDDTSASEAFSKDKPPTSLKETREDTGQVASAAQPSESEVGVTYPNPKSFAERLMKFLELDLAPKCLWWVGDGKGVALNTRRLKEGNVLATHFKTTQYSGFIRNLNRWGFRRVAHFNVDEGAVSYQNALFQKDEPHLVKHMRMDSDVQDVFERHQLSGDAKPSGGKKRKAGTDRRAASKKAAIQAFGAAEATERSSSPGEAPRSRPTTTKEDLLQQTMTLAEQFLNHPGSLGRNDASFNSLFQLVFSQGIRHKQGLLLQQPYPPVPPGIVGNHVLTALPNFLPAQQALERNILSRSLPHGFPNSNNIFDSMLRSREATQQQIHHHLQQQQRPHPTSRLRRGELALHQQHTAYPPESGGDLSERHSESDEALHESLTRESSNSSTGRPRREYATADDLLLRMMRSRGER